MLFLPGMVRNYGKIFTPSSSSAFVTDILINLFAQSQANDSNYTEQGNEFATWFQPEKNGG